MLFQSKISLLVVLFLNNRLSSKKDIMVIRHMGKNRLTQVKKGSHKYFNIFVVRLLYRYDN